MKRHFLYFVIIYATAVVDSTWLTDQPLRPSLLWFLVVAFASMGRPRTSLVWAMMTGLMMDARSTTHFGLHALLAVGLCWGLIRTRRHWCRRGTIAASIAVSATVFVGHVVTSFVHHEIAFDATLMQSPVLRTALLESAGQAAVAMLATAVVFGVISGVRVMISLGDATPRRAMR